ncbi:UDP-N-acetylmuramate:L-alanyl-gamma-D-glutamyl-meso-diaminopimelate ligase [Paraphotobacterium marinum]|uniref:UDP-N-acetylmuramate:L-alanyl-gamma-D-glutamyl-meso-diaminopimelate ligase n=1 Tax=Paraphotobacterium marinum TaxID=1755811 RepID=A0A220VD59_9GAMM|nr:UDP-N-acetylmuramate:L-alanyl-gamma-D-glutamyl-meso-diaminopimelate ligase [Paraphotobacterium marinum]ASK78277.1 UDP-N-acetylmuramate:L-alanyl-gamma-D-glutamyl-meso-diaminopimelate ligase [Paraphotobacterium marinum]
MKIHILGVCGTFMAGIATIAKQLGHEVSGSDQNIYPPMSTYLESLNIKLIQSYDASFLEETSPDLVIIGNALSRGNQSVEYVLDKGIEYVSGPEWLYQNVLKEKWVLAVSGTHGKTSTSSMLTWILEDNGYEPGFLVGGILSNFGCSARLGKSDFFVIEADEYDTSFFDKRSKFIHYGPKTLIINNLEFDHADIFANLLEIQNQFNQMFRKMPSFAKCFIPDSSKNINQLIDMGFWSQLQKNFGSEGLCISEHNKDYSQFSIIDDGDNKHSTIVDWNLIGEHNAKNAVMAIAAAKHIGIAIDLSANSLKTFLSPKRRLELLYNHDNIYLYDDFAHHPTAIKETIQALKNKFDDSYQIIAIFEPRSATMKMGVHNETLLDSFKGANEVYMFDSVNLPQLRKESEEKSRQFDFKRFKEIKDLEEFCLTRIKEKSIIIMMSNGGFNNLANNLKKKLNEKFSNA